jgi:hypothetical protein
MANCMLMCLVLVSGAASEQQDKVSYISSLYEYSLLNPLGPSPQAETVSPPAVAPTLLEAVLQLILPPSIANHSAVSFIKAHPALLQAGAGAVLLSWSKHFAHTVLLLQTIRTVAWPSMQRAATELSAVVERTRVALARVPPEELAEARKRLASAQAEYSELVRALATARAQWRTGTLDEKGLEEVLLKGKQSVARLALQAQNADAALSSLSAVAASVEPSELYMTLSTPLAALASAVTISTSASAAAVVHGVSLGADARRFLCTMLATTALSEDALGTALVGSHFSQLSPLKRKWAGAALDGAGGLVGFLVARRAKAAAATLSAAVLGATAFVGGLREIGGDAVFLQLTGGMAAEEAKLEADWQIVLVLLVVAALLHQMRSPAQLPLLIRLLIWPLTLLEAYLEALSLVHAAVGSLQKAQPPAVTSAPAARATGGPDGGEVAAMEGALPALASSAVPAARKAVSPAKGRPKTD